MSVSATNWDTLDGSWEIFFELDSTGKNVVKLNSGSVSPCSDHTFGFGTACNGNAATGMIPATAAPGQHTIDVQSNNGTINFAQSSFNVVLPTPAVALNPTNGGPATPVDVSATGYDCCDDTTPAVTVTFTDKASTTTTIPLPQGVTLTQCTVSGALGFGFGSKCTGQAVSVQVPAGAASGIGQFTVSTNFKQSVQAPFEVTPPSVAISPVSGSVHTTVLIGAADFPCAGAPCSVNIQFDGTTIATQPLVACGGANGFGFGGGNCPGMLVAVSPPPTATAGAHTFGVNGVTAPFTVTTPTVSISPTSGPLGTGTLISVSATGFGSINSGAGKDIVTVLFDGQGPPEQSGMCSGGNAGFGIGTGCGGAAISISSPTGAAVGPHKVTVQRGTVESASATFIVRTTPTVATSIRDLNKNDVTGKTIIAGMAVHDAATVSGPANAPVPTGSVLFHRFSTANCSSASVDETVSLDSGGVAASSAFSPPVGSLSYLAHYNGDTNYSAADAVCESLAIIPPPPAVSSIKPASGSTAGGTAVTITGSGFVAGATVAFGGAAATSVALVNGTSITANTPAHAEGTVDVTVTNAGSQPGTLSNGFTFAPPIVLSPLSLPSGAARTAYSQTITASGGAAPYTFAVTSGALPAGVTLSSLGVISGTSAATGSFPITVTATDSGGFKGSAGYTLVINAVVIAITPAPASLAGGTVGVAYNQTVTASGGAAPYTFTVSGGTLPAGVTLTSAGALSGSPTAAGSVPFTILATDANGNMGAASYSIAVAKGSATVTLGNLSQTFDGAAKSPTAVTSPAGLTTVFTYSQGATTVPAAVSAGSYTVTASVDDPNYAGSATGTLAINAPAGSPSSPSSPTTTTSTTTSTTTTTTSRTSTTTTTTTATTSRASSVPAAGSVQPTRTTGAGFNGQNDIVFSPSVAQVVGSQMRDYTVEFWAKPAPVELPGAAIISTSAWDLSLVGGDRYVWNVGGRGGPNFSIPPLGFHHVALTYRGASGLLQIFVDGQLVAGQAGFPEPAVPNSPLYLSRSQGGVHWKGQLLYVRISKVVRYPGGGGIAMSGGPGLLAGRTGTMGRLGHLVALAPAQASEFFAPPPGPFVTDVNSIAIWNLNEGSGATIHDASGNNLSGAFEASTGSPVWTDSLNDVPPPSPPALPAQPAQASQAAAPVGRPTSSTTVQRLPSAGAGGASAQLWLVVRTLAAGMLAAAGVGRRLRR